MWGKGLNYYTMAMWMGLGYEDELFGHGNGNLIVKGVGLGGVNGSGQLASGMSTFNETPRH